MALLCKMKVHTVESYGYGHWMLCDEGDAGARPTMHTYYDADDAGPSFECWVPGKSLENVVLQPVSSGGPDDPNQSFAQATPSGKLEMTIDNPAAWGYLEPGIEYFVEIRRARS